MLCCAQGRTKPERRLCYAIIQGHEPYPQMQKGRTTTCSNYRNNLKMHDNTPSKWLQPPRLLIAQQPRRAGYTRTAYWRRVDTNQPRAQESTPHHKAWGAQRQPRRPQAPPQQGKRGRDKVKNDHLTELGNPWVGKRVGGSTPASCMCVCMYVRMYVSYVCMYVCMYVMNVINE